MPIELIAAWLLREAYKLIVVPVASGVRQHFVDKLSEEIAAPVSAKLFGDHVLEAPDGSPSETDTDAGLRADINFVDTIEKAPEAAAVLSAEMGRVLDVNLGSDGVQRGTDGWYVSAYAAILWRIAMLAVWEDRPIAIQGALQGREWVTVCLPRVSNLIEPTKMWRQPDSRTLLRHLNNEGPADFFVRQIEGKSARETALAALNDQFMISPKAAFKPAEVKSIADNWHRMDGVSRKWVLLKPDADAEEAIVSHRPQVQDVFTGKSVTRPNLELHPPKYEEYPAECQPLLLIESERGGIAALSAGADKFAHASEDSALAVEAALNRSR